MAAMLPLRVIAGPVRGQAYPMTPCLLKAAIGVHATRSASVVSPTVGSLSYRYSSTVSSGSTAQEAPATGNGLSWDEFFKIRHRRRIGERLAAVPSTLFALGLGGVYFLDQEIDPTATIFGFDPMLMYGIGLAACGLGGFLVGPVIGSVIWKACNRTLAKSMEAKEAQLYHHIVRHRSDPSLHSIRNPIPDFYGEKIDSLMGYRKWLRKQREHRRKGTFHLGHDD
ncbi:TIM23 complex component [Dimargaris verticillata]|uniref:Presequence translocated-associated motor subunit PAM17 n=1 Tax=Dimargaris verticillata TaxID=2761393 RepID=A0A9W8B2T9_9FUNG|nr:TIM23 complex component [Dimargaris verticillata]